MNGASDVDVRETLKAGREAVKEAVDRLHIDPLRLPRVPWDTLHDLIGPIWPTDLWYVGAATGNGKTSMLAHLIEDWIRRGKRVYVISLEQKQSELRTALAALALDLHPQRCLENRWADLGLTSRERVRDELLRVVRDLETKLVFSQLTEMAKEDVEGEFAFAHRMQADVIVLDHLHRVEGSEEYGSLKRFCGHLDKVSNHWEIPMVAAVQFNRGEKDPLQPYRPPSIYDIQGGEVIRQSASVALGLFRPTIAMSPLDVRGVRQGVLTIKSFVKPHTMGVSIMKHRKRGEAVIEAPVELHYERGRIQDPQTLQRQQEEERWQI